MAHRFSIEGEPKGTYGRVLSLLREHASEFTYDKPVFTFEAEGDGLAALVAAGVAVYPNEAAVEEAPAAPVYVNWEARDINGRAVFKATRNDGVSGEVAQAVLERAQAVQTFSQVVALDDDGNVLGSWPVTA